MSSYTAKNSAEVIADWKNAINNGDRPESIESEMRHHIPELGELHKTWSTLFTAEHEAHSKAQPAFDAMDSTTWPVPFEPASWSQDLKAARRAYEDKLQEFAQ